VKQRLKNSVKALLSRLGFVVLTKEHYDRLVPQRGHDTQEPKTVPPLSAEIIAHQLAAKGDYESARIFFPQILENDPENYPALRGLANVCSYLGRHEEAEKLFRRLVRLDPGDINARITLGQFYAAVGRLSEAAGVFREVLLIDNTNPDAWRGMAIILGGSGAFRAALSSIVETVDAHSRSPEDEQEDEEGSVGEGTGVPASKYRNRERLILVDQLLPLLPREERFTVLDVGARDAEADPRWRVVDPQFLTIHGFEPDEAECERLNAKARQEGRDYHYHPIGLWSEDTTLPFHLNNNEGGNSFFEQNLELTNRWKLENPHAVTYSKDFFYPVESVEMVVKSLRSWAREARISDIDFIKMNVQGAELEILRGAGRLLESVLGLLIEVDFVECYHGHPLFSEADPSIRSAGFTFFDLIAHHYIGRAASPVTAQHLRKVNSRLGQLTSSWGQLIEGHALYLRDLGPGCHEGAGIDKFSIPKLIKLVCIAEIFGQTEYAFELLHWLAAKCRREGDSDTGRKLTDVFDEGALRYKRFM